MVQLCMFKTSLKVSSERTVNCRTSPRSTRWCSVSGVIAYASFYNQKTNDSKQFSQKLATLEAFRNLQGSVVVPLREAYNKAVSSRKWFQAGSFRKLRSQRALEELPEEPFFQTVWVLTQ